MATNTWQSRFDEFHKLANEQTGLNDFGDTDYHEGMHKLLESLDDEGVDGGKAMGAERVILGALVARLQTQAQWNAHPEYRDREVREPVILIGVPRTGTTALHNLLSQDPQFQGIEKWICEAPRVRPPREEWADYPQFQDCVARFEQMSEIAPQAMIAHGVRADDVDECLVPMSQNFCSNMFASQMDLALYDEWLRQADETASYRRYKDILRLVGLHDDRRWLLKNPSHVFGIDAMLTVFPDACVVQTHRHPADSLGSLVSLLENLTLAFSGTKIDRERRLAREASFWAEGLRRTMAAQDRHPDRFVNVLQRDIRRDPIGVVRSIYDKFGLTLSDEARSAMEAWAEENGESGGVGHDYERIERDSPLVEPYAGYIERYGL